MTLMWDYYGNISGAFDWAHARLAVSKWAYELMRVDWADFRMLFLFAQLNHCWRSIIVELLG